MLVVATVAAVTSAELNGSADNRGDRIAGAAAAGGSEHTVTLRNETENRIWVGATVNADGSAPLTDLPVLDPGKSATVTIPERGEAGHWRGKFFPRQGCTGEEGSTFHCEVGDCGPYADRCTTGEQPVSLAEFNFDTKDSSAPWYNVSYVNAVSTPITITPNGVDPPENGGECASVGCPTDLLSHCPPENLTKDEGTGKPLVCVNPNRDAKTAYSEALTTQCPSAYSWSKHDAEQGNQVVRQCGKCNGLTVTFHGNGTSEKPAPDPGSGPGHEPKPGDDEPGSHTDPASAHRRGVALNPVDGTAQALKDSGASWYHNWASSSGVDKPKGVEFVPTIWGPGSVTETELSQAAREGKRLLTFNEPDLPSQANMTPERALDLWPRLEKTGLRLGAPAVAGDADKPGSWLDRFMKGAEKRGLRVDFIPVHWYGSDFGPAATGHLADYLQRVHDRYNKPVWLSEYALIDFTRDQPRYPNQKEQTAFIKSSTKMLESLDFVQRYAWFALSTRTSPTGLYDGTTANAGGKTYRNAG
ncbi:glycosyl hydrolase [Streptomyces sp. 891-h]|uniref:glycosyl hydrolase n=1 Tax=Streptomyces sp. 891-h TaxID=2720714 RepID=UPI001FA99FB0|nr:glycosyl hydrolase [Streptomyces sp. 891-h]